MGKRNRSLGSQLKDQRILMGLTLRQVEDVSKISNAYLSQLENDKIKSPSVSILSKLSAFYGVDLQGLLIAAGIVKSKTESGSKPITSFALSSNNLSNDEEEQLIQYLKFIRSQQRHG